MPIQHIVWAAEQELTIEEVVFWTVAVTEEKLDLMFRNSI
jgi:hypothetical protein